MTEITFEDVLTHYQLKLQEAYDEVEALKNQIKKAEAAADGGWKGPAAEACQQKLETVSGELAKAQSELSEALVLLSAIGEQLVEAAATAITMV